MPAFWDAEQERRKDCSAACGGSELFGCKFCTTNAGFMCNSFLYCIENSAVDDKTG